MFKTPDISPAQLVGLVAAAVGTATAFGITLTAVQQHVLIADAGVIGVLLFGDAVIRHGRAIGNALKAPEFPEVKPNPPVTAADLVDELVRRVAAQPEQKGTPQ